MALDKGARAVFRPGSAAFVAGKVRRGRWGAGVAAGAPSAFQGCCASAPPARLLLIAQLLCCVLARLPQVVADTAVMGPLHVAGFFAVMTLLHERGSWADVRAKLARDFWPTFSADLALWPAVQARWCQQAGACPRPAGARKHLRCAAAHALQPSHARSHRP